MATKNVAYPTLIDIAARFNDGKLNTIVEQLNQTNEVLDDAVFSECNDGAGHKTSIRSGIPEPTWRKLYKGVQPTKSTVTAVRDSTGMLENFSEIDAAAPELAGDGASVAAFRQSEDAPFIEGLSQKVATTLFYGNTDSDPEQFEGLDSRYGILDAENGDNIIDCGGTNDLTSIWLCVWAPTTFHMIYPKGTKAGVSQKDLGEETKTMEDGSLLRVVRSHYKWNVGQSLRDWRYVVRAANIDTEALTFDATTGPNLVDIMTQMLEVPPMLGGGRPAFYMSKKLRSILRLQVKNTKNVFLTMDQVAGRRVLAFDEVPVRRCDVLKNTEAQIADAA